MQIVFDRFRRRAKGGLSFGRALYHLAGGNRMGGNGLPQAGINLRVWDEQKIVDLLNLVPEWKRAPLYGDGHSARQICDILSVSLK